MLGLEGWFIKRLRALTACSWSHWFQDTQLLPLLELLYFRETSMVLAIGLPWICILALLLNLQLSENL